MSATSSAPLSHPASAALAVQAQVDHVLRVQRKPCNKPPAIPIDPSSALPPYDGLKRCCSLETAMAHGGYRLQCTGPCKLWFKMTEACFAVRKCNMRQHQGRPVACPGKRWGECLNCSRALALAYNNKQSDEKKVEMNRKSKECQKRKRTEHVDAAIKERTRLQLASFHRRNRLNELQRLFATQCGLEVGQCNRCRVVVGQVGLHYNHLNDPEKDAKAQILCKIKDPAAYWTELQKCEQLCVTCHVKFTHEQTGCGVEVQAATSASRLKINDKKSTGCVCCGAKPDQQVGVRNFSLDHILNTDKAEWFKAIGAFQLGHRKFNHSELDTELLKCQVLCCMCSQLKTYLEHPTVHTMQKHKEVRELHADVWNWYKERYKAHPEMVRYLTEGRGVTLEFVPMVSAAPRKARKKNDKDDSRSNGEIEAGPINTNSSDEETE
jgi:hypothetical protein